MGLLEAARPFLSGHREIIRSLVIYAWCLGVLLLLYIWLDGTVMLQHFLEYNAQATGFLAGVFDPGTTVSGQIVESDGFAISIVEECTSLAPWPYHRRRPGLPCIILPKAPGHCSWRGGPFGGQLGADHQPVLHRLGLPETLEVVHLLVWQSLMVIFAVALWLLWMRRWGYHAQS